MKKYFVLILLLAPAMLKVSSQDAAPDWGIKLSGFVRNDIFFDTRQSTASNGIREGQFFLYPDNVLMDNQMNDLNANPSFHMLNILTRIRGDISGPDAFGAKTSGVIEAEFFGTSENDINGFRLRHAYVKMDWSKTTLQIGQYWHPLFPVESFPGTLSANTGAPFSPFSRNPQVRVTRKYDQISLTVTAYSQRDFVSSGPDGNSNKYLRNSSIPGFNFQLRAQSGDLLTAWAGFDYKNLRPELRTSANVETTSRIGSFSVFANMKFKTQPLSVSIMGIYGQNASDLAMLGGYAVSEITDPVNQEKSYTTLNSLNLWSDLTTNGKRVIFGLFTGYSKNLGSGDDIVGAVYGRGNNIDHLFRVSPRVTVTEGRLTFGAEVENTLAAYGTMQTDGKVTNTENVSNLRILLSTIYKF